MSADRLQEDRLRTLVVTETEDDPEIVSRAAGPRAFERALELVGPELRMKGILGQKLERCLDVASKRGIQGFFLTERLAARTKAEEGSRSLFTRECF